MHNPLSLQRHTSCSTFMALPQTPISCQEEGDIPADANSAAQFSRKQAALEPGSLEANSPVISLRGFQLTAGQRRCSAFDCSDHCPCFVSETQAVLGPRLLDKACSALIATDEWKSQVCCCHSETSNAACQNTHHIQCGDSHELLLVIHAHSLQCLCCNRHCGVYRV